MQPNQELRKRESAYHELRRLLILQQVPEGTRLRESEWTQRLQVNRSALREAFARLAAEGLIESGPKSGYFVPVFTREDIYHVMAVRMFLEGGAIEIICGSGWNTPERLKAASDACAQLERMVREDYQLSVVEADRRFHEALIDAANNEWLKIAYRHSPLPIVHPEVLSGSMWEERVQKTLREHQAILATLLEGDAPRAQCLLRAHLTSHWGPPAFMAQAQSKSHEDLCD